MFGIFDNFSNIIYLVVVLVVLFGLTERWRIEFQAKRKRERQNKKRPGIDTDPDL
jgi:hypothetical protein